MVMDMAMDTATEKISRFILMKTQTPKKEFGVGFLAGMHKNQQIY